MAAGEYLREHQPEILLDAQLKEHFHHHLFHGFDFDNTMPQSLSRILIHLVFSTKNRERVLTPAIQTELHPYLAGTLDNIEWPRQ